jgi:hypothetical protein
MWTLRRDEVVTKPRFDIQSKKFMFTITLNPNDFYIVDRLPNNTKMNSAYFVTNIFILFEQAIFPRRMALHQKQLVVHLDNCSVHTSLASRNWLEEHGMRRMPQPSYSWSGPLWLLLVSYSERENRTDSDRWRRPVFESLQTVLRAIDREELNKVFQTWV